MLLFSNFPKKGLLIINGKDVTEENVMIHSGSYYAELPLTKVMNSLDIEVDWIDDDTADLTYNNKKYTLFLSDISLFEEGQDFNLLWPPPGGRRFYKILEKELVLDSNTIKSSLYQMGIKISIEINRKERTVNIEVVN